MMRRIDPYDVPEVSTIVSDDAPVEEQTGEPQIFPEPIRLAPIRRYNAEYQAFIQELLEQ